MHSSHATAVMTFVVLFSVSKSAKLSNSKLGELLAGAAGVWSLDDLVHSGQAIITCFPVPADGMLCGPSKMGFKFSKSELIERFKSLADNNKDPVEVVQVYVAASKPEPICLFDPALVEDRKSINVAVTEFEDGEKGHRAWQPHRRAPKIQHFIFRSECHRVTRHDQSG